jgi:uncharacterized cysteine cluster protein YcgN (CxxCxxCC family)
MPTPSLRSLPAASSPKARGGEPRGTRHKKPQGQAELPAQEPFWKQKALEALNPREWESLCDGCGRCCLVKLEEQDSGEIHFTDIACKLFNMGTCRCSDYAHRRRKVHDCIKLTPAKVRTLSWLPPTCAYRMVAEGRDLAWWHPLVSGSATTVHAAGVSAQSAANRPAKSRAGPPLQPKARCRSIMGFSLILDGRDEFHPTMVRGRCPCDRQEKRLAIIIL